MAIKALINGQVQAGVAVDDRGLQYGDGVFETIAVAEAGPLCLDEHFSRLREGCERLSIPPPALPVLRAEVALVSGSNPSSSPGSNPGSSSGAVVKIILTRGEGGRGYAPPAEARPNRIVALYPWPAYPSEHASAGVRLRFCQRRYGINPALAGIKHLNRLEQILARAEWQDQAIAEALVMDLDDNVIEGTMSNFFMVKDNLLLTSDLHACGVRGVIRQKIIGLAAGLGLAVHEQAISQALLRQADEIFLCNSLIGVWPARMLADRPFKPGPITRRIRRALIGENAIIPPC